jgi:hypothetical protein
MPRRLPDHPNLDHLKKQAKDLLVELRRRTPAMQLADAQHALAREFGFASWTKLKTHVESTTSALAGRWSANLQKSRPHPLNPFRMATLEISLAGNRATFAFASVDPRGEEQRGEPTIVIDGHHHAMDHGIGYVAKWLGPRVLEVTATKDGHPTGRGLYEVSANGRALTVSYSRSSPNGLSEAEHWLVFDRMLHDQPRYSVLDSSCS